MGKNTNYKLAWISLAFCFAAACSEQTNETVGRTQETPSAKVDSAISAVQRPDRGGIATELVLSVQRSNYGSKPDLVKDIEMIADEEGIPSGKVLVDLFELASRDLNDLQIESLVRHLTSAVAVDGGPEMMLTALADAPAGLLRRHLVGFATGGYYDTDKDPPGRVPYDLKRAYKMMPESGDRTHIAETMATKAMIKSGMRNAIDIVSQFETREEMVVVLGKMASTVCLVKEQGIYNAESYTEDEISILIGKLKEMGMEREIIRLEALE